MHEPDARAAVAMRVIETTPGAAPWWTPDDRATASARAVAAAADGRTETFLAARARLVLERATECAPSLGRFFSAFAWRPWIAPAAIAAAFVVGLAGDHVGGAERVNLLAPPFFALLAWNLVVYGLLAWRALRHRRDTAGPLRRWFEHLAAARPERRANDSPGERALMLAFVQDWTRRAGPLYALRAAAALHAAAAAVAAGAVVGMYVRGLAFEYRAGWQSTFLDATAVHALLAGLLAPAAWVTGRAIPPVEHLALLRTATAAGGENAAPWLHLYAMTLFLFVIAPRMVLALTAHLRARRLANRVDPGVADPYFRRLLRTLAGGPLAVAVVPYSFAPAARLLATLEGLLARVAGRCSVTVLPGVAYGGEPPPLPADAGVLVPLFNATATPEDAVHGAFVAALRERAHARADVLAVVDESAWRARWPDDPARLAARRRAWTDVLAPHAAVTFLDEHVQDDEGTLAALEAALPAGR